MRFMHGFSFICMHSFPFVLIVYGFAFVIVIGSVFGEQGQRPSGSEDRNPVRILTIRFRKCFYVLCNLMVLDLKVKACLNEIVFNRVFVTNDDQGVFVRVKYV